MPSESILSVAERSFASILSASIADDAASTPVRGALRRAVISWFEVDQPTYVMVHLRGEGDAADLLADPWRPSAWNGTDKDMDRGNRVVSAAELDEPARTLAVIYGQQLDEVADSETGGQGLETEPGFGVSRAIVETVRALPDALRSRGVELATDFAATALHFQETGGLDVFRETAPDELFQLFRDRGELPPA